MLSLNSTIGIPVKYTKSVSKHSTNNTTSHSLRTPTATKPREAAHVKDIKCIKHLTLIYILRERGIKKMLHDCIHTVSQEREKKN